MKSTNFIEKMRGSEPARSCCLALILVVFLSLVPGKALLPSSGVTRGQSLAQSSLYASSSHNSRSPRRRALYTGILYTSIAALTIYPSSSLALSYTSTLIDKRSRYPSPFIPINQQDPSLMSLTVSQSSIDKGGKIMYIIISFI